MKKIFLLSMLLVLLYSCGEEEVKKEYTVISGKIENFKSRSITLLGLNYNKKISFDRKTGTFRDTLTDIPAGNYAIKVSKRQVPLYITPDSKTNITFDIKDRTENPVFTGENAKINTYLSERIKKFGLILGNARKLFSLNESEFLSKVDKYKSTLTDLVNSSQLPEDFTKKELRNIQYELVRNLNNYEGFYRLLNGDEEFEVSSNFPKNFIKEVDLNNSEDYLFSNQYRLLIDELVQKIANDRKPEDGDYRLTLLETVNAEVNDTLIKNDMVFKLAENSITYTSALNDYYTKFMSYSTNPEHKKIITKTYEKLKLTDTGMPSPKFNDYVNYDGGTTSLDDLIGKGKYLYVDVWATWCGFCKKEIPLLKRYEQKYHGKNIEFVSISVDKKNVEQKWRKTIEEKEMGGVQLFSGQEFSDLQFAKDYSIKGLPRFILIDPEGKIVTANAPFPSDGEKLEEIFDALDI